MNVKYTCSRCGKKISFELINMKHQDKNAGDNLTKSWEGAQKKLCPECNKK